MNGGGGDTLFGRNIVLVFSADGPVRCEQPGLDLAGFCNNFAQADILTVIRPDLTAIKPQNVDASIIAHQLHDLIVGKGDELFPELRMLFRDISRIAPGTDRLIHPLCPVPGAVPVRLGEIGCDAKSFFAERIKHIFYKIGMTVCMERAVR